MKPIKFIFLFFTIAIFTCNVSLGQPMHKTVVVTIDGFDYGGAIGIVSGTYTYHFMYKLNKEGYIESVHWNVRDIDLHNDKGDKVKVIDSGLDTYGVFWNFWNTPNQSNIDSGAPEITYNVSDGWLNSVMPAQMPPEGVLVNMSVRIQVKNEKIRFGMLWIVNFNANGDPVVDFMKFH